MNKLIDGDILCFRASAATQGKIYLYRGERFESIKEMTQIYGEEFRRDAVETVYEPEPVTHAYKILDRMMDNHPFSKAYVGGKANFRYEVATIKDYKGTRSGVARPPHLDACKQYMCDKHEAMRPSGPWETDDQIALEAEEGDIVVSLDKDFLQLHNIILEDPITGKKKETTEVSGMASLYKQVLTGDTADSIPGCYGVGAKAVSVKKLDTVDKEVDMCKIVMEEYKKRYHKYAEKFMCENLKLLYLLRSTDLQWVNWFDAEKFYGELKG